MDKNILTITFIGHRKLGANEDEEKLKIRLKNLIEYFIVSENAVVFRFGSKSEFNVLSHKVVSALQEKYPKIVRINHTCGEFVVKGRDKKEFYENALKNLNQTTYIEDYEEIIYSDRVKKANIASYVERNNEMINLSDICIFYYDKNYELAPRKGELVRKSGTEIAYNFAKQRKKRIINLFEE